MPKRTRQEIKPVSQSGSSSSSSSSQETSEEEEHGTNSQSESEQEPCCSSLTDIDTDDKPKVKEQVLVNYEILEPQDRLKSGIRKVLYPYAKKYLIDVFSLAESVTDQVNIGSIICIEDESIESTSSSLSEEKFVLGVITLLNIKQHETILGGTLKWVRERCEAAIIERRDNDKKSDSDENQFQTSAKKMLAVLDSSSTGECQIGLLILEYMKSAVPGEISCAGLNGLTEDVKWSLDAEDCEEEEKKFYRFDDILIFLEVEIINNSRSGETEISQSGKANWSFNTADDESLFDRASFWVSLGIIERCREEKDQSSPPTPCGMDSGDHHNNDHLNKKSRKTNRNQKISDDLSHRPKTTRHQTIILLVPYSRFTTSTFT